MSLLSRATKANAYSFTLKHFSGSSELLWFCVLLIIVHAIEVKMYSVIRLRERRRG